MNTILITGGAGFIGGCLVRQLVQQTDLTVVNLDLLTYAGCLESLADVRDHPQHVFVQGDIRDRSLVGQLLREHDCDAIVNLAAESHVDRSITGPGPFVTTNVVGTYELLEAALSYWKDLKGDRQQAFRFLHVSTDEVFGSLGPTGTFNEATAYAPNSPYAASKAAADHFVRSYYHTFGLPTLITNCSNNYGPYQFPEKLIPLMILNAFEGKALPIYGKGDNVRDWLHVEDHCGALQMVLQSAQPGSSYNIGGNCELTNLEVVKTICRAVDQALPPAVHQPCDQLIDFVTDRPGHDQRYAIDATLISNQLGWQPTISFAEGIRMTVDWYAARGDWVSAVKRKYDGERLGLPGVSGPDTVE